MSTKRCPFCEPGESMGSTPRGQSPAFWLETSRGKARERQTEALAVFPCLRPGTKHCSVGSQETKAFSTWRIRSKTSTTSSISISPKTWENALVMIRTHGNVYQDISNMHFDQWAHFLDSGLHTDTCRCTMICAHRSHRAGSSQVPSSGYIFIWMIWLQRDRPVTESSHLLVYSNIFPHGWDNPT